MYKKNPEWWEISWYWIFHGTQGQFCCQFSSNEDFVHLFLLPYHSRLYLLSFSVYFHQLTWPFSTIFPGLARGRLLRRFPSNPIPCSCMKINHWGQQEWHSDRDQTTKDSLLSSNLGWGKEPSKFVANHSISIQIFLTSFSWFSFRGG